MISQLAVAAMGVGAGGNTTPFLHLPPCFRCHFCDASCRKTIISPNSLLDYPFGKGQRFKISIFPLASLGSHGPFLSPPIVVACSLRNKIFPIN